MHRVDAPDRPASIDMEPAAANHLPRPLAAQERSRLEAETWNWNAVKIYPGGHGPGVPFPTYADGAAQRPDPAERVSDATLGDGAPDDVPSSRR